MNPVGVSLEAYKSYRRRKREVPTGHLSEKNLAALRRIIERTREAFHSSCLPSRFAQSNPEISYWSIALDMECLSCGKGERVKIPKADWGSSDTSEVQNDPLSRRMGQSEFQNLQWLQAFSSSLGEEFGAVEPLAYWEDFNAIVTRRLRGRDLYEVCREDAQPWRKHLTPQVRKFLRNCGVWLGSLHAHTTTQTKTVCDSQGILELTKPALEFLVQRGLARPIAEELKDRLLELNVAFPCPVATCMSGFEVRNVFISDGRLVFLDPGDLVEGYTAQDVARFLVSVEILFWGSARFLLPLPLRKQMRDALLEGYCSRAPLDAGAVCLWEVKHLVWYWKEGYAVLSIKGYSRALSYLMRKLYMDRFFRKAVMNRLDALSS